MSGSYISLYKSGELEQRAIALEALASPCTLCPAVCKAERKSGTVGRCRSGFEPVVASWGPHHGEEPPLVGSRGSGTIFFSNCNLHCAFCQNFDISQSGYGQEISPNELGDIMLELQTRGCHNINIVSPTHFCHVLPRALLHAIPKGLKMPIVYNSGGYDSIETLKLLEGVVDVYMPDFKFSDAKAAESLSGADGYPQVAAKAVREMHNQVGDLILDKRGVAVRGLLVRHLVLPEDLAGSRGVIDFIRHISSNTYLNIMDQYRPAYRARSIADLGRRVTLNEYDEVVSYAVRAGLTRILGVTTR